LEQVERGSFEVKLLIYIEVYIYFI
jgi:hypothetical protein